MKRNGYTLIELALVVFLLGLMLVLAVPRIRETLISDGLKTTVRQLVGAAKELRTDAVREQLDYKLNLDVSNNAFWTSVQDMTTEKLDEQRKKAVHFPEGVRIADVSQMGMDKKSDGEISVKFYRQGNIQPTVIHLVKEQRHFTILLSPFLNTIKIYDKYADVTPEGVERD
ncbi:MAG TPA: prepilin-type N-terminal cleavage/methylation domain-containing protein [Syntrophales bacterium]|nr:prepilin-type N-terminal cleavage/methylation domain-containing protein [Syntrophales bacterium]